MIAKLIDRTLTFSRELDVATHRVIFDTDPGVDDALALLFCHRHPDIELLGITTVFGNADVDLTTRNARFLKQRWGIAAPVVRGASRPVHPARPQGPWPTWIHGRNGLGDHPGPETIEEPDGQGSAHGFIVDTVRRHPGAITLLAVGRMTNLALALEEAPDIAGLVREVVIMGGAFGAPGNVTPAAEANIHGDPEAADRVLTASWPVTAVGLDVTRAVVMTRERLDRLAEAGGEAAAMVRSLSADYIAYCERSTPDGMLVHDGSAAVYLTDPKLFITRSGSIRVVTEGLATGMTIQKPDGLRSPPSPWDEAPSQRACTGVDAAAVLDVIHRTIRTR